MLSKNATVTAMLIGRFAGRSQLEKKLFGGAFWMIIGAACSRAGMFAAAFLVARIVGRVAFGKYGAIESTVGMFVVFANLGLTVSTTKLLAQYRLTDSEKAGRILALCELFALGAGTLVAVCLVTAAPWLAAHTLADAGLTTDLRIAALALFFGALNATLAGALTALQAFRSTARINVAAGILSVPALAGGAAAAGVRGAIWGLVTIQAITCVLQWWALKRSALSDGIWPNWSGCWAERGTLFRFSLPALINSSLNAPVNWLCITLLLNFGGGYPQMGLLQVANAWLLAALFFSGKLAQVYFPMLEELIARGDDYQAQRFVWKLVRWNAAAFSLGALVVTLLARVILHAYGPQYAAGAPALIATAWTAVVVAVSQPLAVYLVVRSRMWQMVFTSVVWAGINVLLASSLVTYGAAGIATARLVAYIGSSLLVIGIAAQIFKAASAPRARVPNFATAEAA